MAKPTTYPIGASAPAVTLEEIWKSIIVNLGGSVTANPTELEALIQTFGLTLFNNALPNANNSWLGPANCLGATLPRNELDTATAAFTTGQIYMAQAYLPANQVISNINFLPGTTGDAGPTHQWGAIFGGTSRTMLGVSADATSTVITASTPVAYPIATIASGAGTSFITAGAGLHYLAICITTANAPTYTGITGLVGANTVPPILSGSPAATASTPPTFPFTTGVLTPAAVTPYMWVS